MSASKAYIPSVYTHASQADWGRGVVTAVLADRTTYVFEHAGERTFMNGANAIREITLPVEEREALAKTLLRRRAAPKTKAAGRRAAASPAAMTFERQLAIFRAAFPLGFDDPKFIAEERGGPQVNEPRKDAALALARDLLSRPKLDAAIESGAFGEVFANAAAVLAALQSLSFPKADKAGFDRTSQTAHERFALALRDLLYGDGDYAPRFDAFVSATSKPSWTVATIFAATVHPDTHFFVKPTVNQKQAKSIDRGEPATGAPTGRVYAEHLAIAQSVRARLIAVEMRPRDLFDVYSFEWHTLTRTAQAASK